MTDQPCFRPRPTPPPDPRRIVYHLEAVRPDAKAVPLPLTRDDLIPDQLCRLVCAPGPTDPRAARDYLGSMRWTGPFTRYLAGTRLPWWRHPYVVARLTQTDPRALRLVQLAHAVAEATGAPIIQVVPQVAPRLGMRARPAWLLYLRTESAVKRLGVRTTPAA